MGAPDRVAAMIAILTPSRQRPRRAREMVAAIFDTCESPANIHVYLGLDLDDLSYPLEYERPVTVTHGERRTAGAWTNLLSEIALQDGADVLAFLGDDHRPRTPGWDTQVLEALATMGPGLVYTADGLQDERLPTAPFWSAQIITALGWFYPPVLKHLYADDYWLTLARDLDRCTYLPDVLIEHMHPSAGKAEMDDLYRQNDTHYDEDRQAFERFLVEQHPAVLERVRCVL